MFSYGQQMMVQTLVLEMLFWWLIELPYWFLVSFVLKFLGILTMSGEKDNSHSYESTCSVKSSLRKTRLLSHQRDDSLLGILSCCS